MTGNFIDTLRFKFKKTRTDFNENTSLVLTDFGQVRVLDTAGNKPIIISVPDGPNVIEHHLDLVSKLSKSFRVICFEFPGLGFSFPNSRFDYTSEKASKLIINLMDELEINKATLSFSCSNGFYAIKTSQLFPERIERLFLSQTPSLHAMEKWTEKAIPNVLKIPVIGQIVNAFSEKKFSRLWYKYALPKHTDSTLYKKNALHALESGGCFCLSSLVQGLSKDKNTQLNVNNVPATLIWGSKDFTHQNTEKESILEHLPNCEIIEFEDCGHFPELENTDRFVSIVNDRMNSSF